MCFQANIIVWQMCLRSCGCCVLFIYFQYTRMEFHKYWCGRLKYLLAHALRLAYRPGVHRTEHVGAWMQHIELFALSTLDLRYLEASFITNGWKFVCFRCILLSALSSPHPLPLFSALLIVLCFFELPRRKCFSFVSSIRPKSTTTSAMATSDKVKFGLNAQSLCSHCFHFGDYWLLRLFDFCFCLCWFFLSYMQSVSLLLIQHTQLTFGDFICENRNEQIH